MWNNGRACFILLVCLFSNPGRHFGLAVGVLPSWVISFVDSISCARVNSKVPQLNKVEEEEEEEEDASLLDAAGESEQGRNRMYKKALRDPLSRALNNTLCY